MPDSQTEAVNISNIQGAIQNTVDKIKNAKPIPSRTVGKQIRPMIKSVISEIKKDVEDPIAQLSGIVDSSIKLVASASDTFERSASDIRDAVTAMNSKNLEKETLRRASLQLTDPIIEESISNYETAANNPGIGLETLGWSQKNNPDKWAVHCPRWPELWSIRVNRIKGSTDPNYPPTDFSGNEVTTKETTAFYSFPNAKVNIRNFIDCLKVEGIAAVDYSGSLTNNKDPITGKTIYSSPLEFDYWPEGDPPLLRVYLPRGREGDLSQYAQYRAFTKLLYKRAPDNGTADRFRWNYPNSAYTPFYIRHSQLSIANSSVSLADFEWVAITFQKSAFMENPEAAKGNSQQATHGKIFVDTTNKVVIDENWDWNSRVTVFLQRGKHAVASLIDANGRKFSRTVQWMCNGCDMPGSWRYNDAESLLFGPATMDGSGERIIQWEYCLPYQEATTITQNHYTSSDGYTVHVLSEYSPKITESTSYENTQLVYMTSTIFMIPVEIVGFAINMPQSKVNSIHG